MASAAPIQNRPYRSHKVPACTRCRSRKIRCHIDIPGEPCLSCRERRLKCQYVESSTSSPTEENGDRKPAKRRRISNTEIEDGPARPRSAPILHKATNNPSASIIMASHLAEDLDIFNRHLAKHRKPGGKLRTRRPIRHSIMMWRIQSCILRSPDFEQVYLQEVGAGDLNWKSWSKSWVPSSAKL